MRDAELRRMVWEQYLDSEMRVRYWCLMSERVHRNDRILAMTGLAASSATLLGLITTVLGAPWTAALAGVSLLVSLASFGMRLSRETAIAAKSYDAALEERTDAQLLWGRTKTSDEGDVRAELEKLKRRHTDLAREISTSLPTDDKLRKRCFEETLKVLGAAA